MKLFLLQYWLNSLT